MMRNAQTLLPGLALLAAAAHLVGCVPISLSKAFSVSLPVARLPGPTPWMRGI